MKYLFVFIVIVLALSSCAKSNERKPSSITRKLNDAAIELSKYGKDSVMRSIQLLDSAIKIDSSYILAYNNKLSFLNQIRDYNGALTTLKAMEGRDDKNKSLFLLIGIHYERIGIIDSAFIYYNKSLDVLTNVSSDDCKCEVSLAVTRLLLYNEHFDSSKYPERCMKVFDSLGFSSSYFIEREKFLHDYFGDKE